MNAISYMVLAAALGVDYGWQQTDNGEWEYIVQVEPALLNALEAGERIVSELPPELQGVRRIVLRVGTQEVPRDRIPNVLRTSGQQTVRRAGERWVGDTPIPLAKEELPDRPRLDFVPFNDAPRGVGNRWTPAIPPTTNRDRDSHVLSVPNRVFGSPTKKTATEISSFPPVEREADPYRSFPSRDKGFGADTGLDNRRPLPGPASDDPNIRRNAT